MDKRYLEITLDPRSDAAIDNLAHLRKRIDAAKRGSYDGIALPAGSYPLYADGQVALDLTDLENFWLLGKHTRLCFSGAATPIVIRACKTVRLRQISIEWAEEMGTGAAIDIDRSEAVTLEDVTLLSVPDIGVSAHRTAGVNFYRMIVRPNHVNGLSAVLGDAIYLKGCRDMVNVNTCLFSGIDGTAIKIDADGQASYLDMENCIFRQLPGAAVRLDGITAKLQCDLFDHCATAAVIHGNGDDNTVEMSENRIFSCGKAIWLKGLGKAVLYGNTVIGDYAPLRAEQVKELLLRRNTFGCGEPIVCQECRNVQQEEDNICTQAEASYFHPTVFAVGDTYQIMQPCSKECLYSIRIGDELFDDEANGILRSARTVHRVTVPQAVLDAAKSYTVIRRWVIDRVHNTPAIEEAVAETTYPFIPVSGSSPRAYYIADAHSFIRMSVDAAKVFGDIDFLILNGDIQSHSAEPLDFLFIYDIASALTAGQKPVICVRGNHETLGRHAETIGDYIPTDNGRTFFTVRLGHMWFLCLDCGCDHRDDHPEYTGTMRCHHLRERQTAFLHSVIKNAKNEYAQPEISHKIVICHVPFTDHLYGRFTEEPEIYRRWQELIGDHIRPELMIAGHMHEYSIHRSGPFPMIVATQRTADRFGGTGFAFSADQIVACSTDSDGSRGEDIVFPLH